MIDPEIWYHVAFWTIAGIMVIAAIFTIEAKEVMHSIYGLATTFISIAMFFILLGAEYIAMMQILVYVGAVTVLMAFAIMLTRRRIKPLSEEEEERERLEDLREEEELIADHHSDTFDGGEE